MFLRIAVFLSLAAGSAQVTDKHLRDAEPEDWLSYNGSYDSRRHSRLSQINRDNVGVLVPKWIYHVPNASHLESVPVVVDGTMYITQPNEVYALDGRTGREIW